MENTSKKKAYTKSRLIKELAFRAGITQNQSRAALEAIIEIAYREAKTNFFILPGLCKFDVVHRNERNVRNPATGEMLILPPRESLRVALSKRAKETVVPRVAPMKPAEYEVWKKEHAPAVEPPSAEPIVETPVPETVSESPVTEPVIASPIPEPAPEAPAVAPVSDVEVPQPAVAEAEPAVTEPPPAPDAAVAEEPPVSAEEPTISAEEPAAAEGPEISFRCSVCGQEVIAPSDAIGCEAECPACGAIIVVPAHSEVGTTYAPGGDANKEIISTEQAGDLVPAALKNRTIRIDSDLFEDLASPKPSQTPGPAFAEAMKNRTMRIDLPDEF